jgi:predicted SnoaL-like aldol condensation-catalyzing enzyme
MVPPARSSVTREKCHGDVGSGDVCSQADLVWTHSLVTGLPGGARAVSVDIWRVEQQEIVEHWDVGQRVDSTYDSDAMFC